MTLAFEVEMVGAVPGTPGVEVKKGPIQVRFLGKKAFRGKGKLQQRHAHWVCLEKL